MPIRYLTGDATEPEPVRNGGPRIIAHIVNPVGAWGAGFVLAVSQKWPHIRPQYLDLCAQFDAEKRSPLGHLQVVPAQPGLFVANLFGQLAPLHKRPIRYDALYNALEQLTAYIANELPDASVHMPRIGAGLARGHWPIIEAIIEHTLVDAGVPTFVYDLAAASTSPGRVSPRT